MIVDHTLARLGVLPRTAPALALHGLLPREVEILVESVVVPVRSLVGHVTGLTGHTVAPRTVRGLVDSGTLAGILHAPLLPACSLGNPGRGLRIATGLVEFARAPGVTVRSLDECAHVRLAVARPGMTVCGHTGPAPDCVTVTGRPFPLTVRGLGRGVSGLGGDARIVRRLLLTPGIVATLGQGWSLPLR